jgi:hypothetical protein
MVLDGAERIIQPVNKWDAGRDLKTGYLGVGDSIEVLYECAEAIAVRRNEHRPT